MSDDTWTIRERSGLSDPEWREVRRKGVGLRALLDERGLR